MSNPTTAGSRPLVVLLRGINVGKAHRIAMADLRAATSDAGCTQVRSVRASGNLVVVDTRPAPELRDVLSAAYSERFGYTAVLQVLEADAVRRAAERAPLDPLPEHHLYLVFCDEPALLPELADRAAAALAGGATDDSAPADTEGVAAGVDCLYWRVPRGRTLISPVAAVWDTPAHRRHLTSRTLPTVEAILKAV